METRPIGRGRGRLIKPKPPSPPGEESTNGSNGCAVSSAPQPATPLSCPAITTLPSPAITAPTPKNSGRGLLRQMALKKITPIRPGPSTTTQETLPSSNLAEQMENVSLITDNLVKSVPRLEQRTRLEPRIVKARGTNGTPIKVRTNCVKLNYSGGREIYQHHVGFEPDVDNRSLRGKLLKSACTVKRGIRCFDGGSILFMPEKIQQFTKKVEIDGETYAVTVKPTRHLEISECVPLFGTLIRNCCKELGYTLLGRSFYNMTDFTDLSQHSLRVWSGFLTSVDEKDDGVYLTFDTCSRVLQTATGYSWLLQLRERHAEGYMQAAAKEIIGTSVVTLYNNKMYRVDDIHWRGTPATTTFSLLDGTTMTIQEYFWKQYKLEIHDPNQPLFIVKSLIKRGPLKDQIVYLVPELCRRTGITDEMRKDFRVMKELSSYLKLSPAVRQKTINKMVQKFKENQVTREMLSEWGLEVADHGDEISARTMDSNIIEFGRGKMIQDTQDWKREVQNSAYAPFRNVQISNWVVIHTGRDKSKAMNFIEMLIGVFRKVGTVISNPQILEIPNDRLATIQSMLQNGTTSETQALVFVMGSERSDIYSLIKKFCIHTRPMASQVVLSRNLSKPDKLRPIVTNIALQIVAKMGGSLWKVVSPLKSTMICGIDTYHDMGGKNSVAALVASVDRDFTSYFSKAVLQDPRMELMAATYRCATSALTAYFKVNNDLPARIIVFRDGVSHGDHAAVLREVDQLRMACRDYKATYDPAILFVLCMKRINIRYYTAGASATNVPPGTVVDHKITNVDYQNFLLVSQTSSQGTLTPTHYVILQDDASLDVDKVQRITYHLCHNYYNWAGTVRVPAPCVYAHKLAGLVGQYVKTYPDTTMDNKLYYL